VCFSCIKRPLSLIGPNRSFHLRTLQDVCMITKPPNEVPLRK
jgi:hypothetical protein